MGVSDVLLKLGGVLSEFTVKEVRSTSRLTELRVSVDDRESARQKIQDFLDKNLITYGPAPISKSSFIGTEIKTQTGNIQLIYKPVRSAGSGAGAAVTKLAESAQCVYAAVAFGLGRKITNADITQSNVSKFSSSFDVDGDLDKIINELPEDWINSSVLGANKLFETLSGTGYKFVRGDSVLDDGAIKNAYGRVKGQTNLSSEDKWNPADIWAVKQSQINEIKNHLNSENTIDCLNNALLQRFNDGSLIGISLKKITSVARISAKNNQSASVRKANESAKFQKYELTFLSSMDVYFYHGSGQFDKFQARNFAGAGKGDWKLELKGATANQGKIQGTVVIELLRTAGFSNISQFKIPTWEESDPKARKAEDITTEIYNLLKEYNATKLDKSKNAEEDNKSQIAAKDKSWRYSKLAGLRFLDWLQKTCSDKDMAMKEMYLYASSQSDASSPYYKLE